MVNRILAFCLGAMFVFQYNSFVKNGLGLFFITLAIFCVVKNRFAIYRLSSVSWAFFFLVYIGTLDWSILKFDYIVSTTVNFGVVLLYFLATPRNFDLSGIRFMAMPVGCSLAVALFQYFDFDWAWDLRGFFISGSEHKMILDTFGGNKPFGLSYYSITLAYQALLFAPILLSSFFGNLFTLLITTVKSAVVGYISAYILRLRLGGIYLVSCTLVSLVAVIYFFEDFDIYTQSSIMDRLYIYNELGLSFLSNIVDFRGFYGGNYPEDVAPHNFYVNALIRGPLVALCTLISLSLLVWRTSITSIYFLPLLGVSIHALFHNDGITSGFYPMVLIAIAAIGSSGRVNWEIISSKSTR
jgi:hypothetical protein